MTYIFPEYKKVHQEKGVELKNGEYCIDESGGLALRDLNGDAYYYPKEKTAFRDSVRSRL